jgi:hypothetical protein
VPSSIKIVLAIGAALLVLGVLAVVALPAAYVTNKLGKR